MARSIPSEEGGSATGILVTDKSHGLGCDAAIMRLKISKREAFINDCRGNELGYC
jgi:hypothetical protein